MKKKKQVLKSLSITDYAAEGKALGRLDGKVIFVEGAVPGDTADVLITRNKKDWAEGKALTITQFSKDRVKPFCKHFGLCGGCKWQMLPYDLQLKYKQQEAEQNLRRIGKMALPALMPILGADKTENYRNKLEFTFSDKRYLLPQEVEQLPKNYVTEGALGYHVPRIFDKIIDIEECFLMDDINNSIRNNIRAFALENKFTYYNIKEHAGWLRNIIIRNTTKGQLMLNLILGYEDMPATNLLMDFILKSFPQVTTLIYTINKKWNDTIYDLEPVIYFGPGFITEKLGNYNFKISPKSFFQTNSRQAESLYTVTKNFARLTGNEIVYDLYCGTGSIGIFCSDGCKKLIGVDVVEDAIKDAKQNAVINNISHASFYSGDVIEICNNEFFEKNGRPDVIIIDPPRAGMHEKLINKLIEIKAARIVYVSCNVATQARDLSLLADYYDVEKIQPVDMFPHTHHIECVASLTLKN
ncbi:MAG: 23S rRNA (uracil(1939)-C(5))-methyltransferase RlmD [Ginsengibacter sp.]